MSFLAPLGLWLGALAAPLIALYFVKLRRKRVTVSSVLLWQRFAQESRKATPFQRFRSRLLLWLQLLLLALLVFALARPALETAAPTGRALVLVLDSSASMGATDGDPTRFADAQRAAQQVLDTVGPADEVMLVLAGATTELLVPFTHDVAAVRAAVEQARVTESEGRLEEALLLGMSLARSKRGVELLVLSDGGNEDLANLPQAEVEVRYVKVGSLDRNVAITALDVRRSGAANLDRQAFVTLESFGSEPAAASIEAYLDGALLRTANAKLEPGQAHALVFDLPAGAAGVLHLHVDAAGDLLPADDDAFAILQLAAPRHVLAVEVDRLTLRALESDPQSAVTAVRASEVTVALLDRAHVVVAAAPIPSSLTGRNALLLGASAAVDVSAGDELAGPAITGWRRSHPALRYVQLDGVLVARSHAVADAAGLASIVDSTGGALVLAGERGGARRIQLMFDPLASDLPLRVAWPVFVLNSVSWLSEREAGQSDATQTRTGQPLVRRVSGVVPSDLVVQAPDGVVVDARWADGFLRLRGMDGVGVYDVRAGAASTRIAANLLSPRESQITPAPILELGTAAKQAALGPGVGQRELWRPLLLLALGLLVVEWAVWGWRRS